ncbi:MAG TPA: cyclase family protein [Desulfomonilaceae bacterium]|nr:cyclase family protein [Desulfomonilaceae bacterium]
MALYDVTLPLGSRTLIFPGDPSFEINPLFRLSQGDPFNLSRITMGTHLGTHVDPPSHYLTGGAAVDGIPLESLIGPGIVLDMRGKSVIDRTALIYSHLENHVRVLLKTDNGPKLLASEFDEHYVHLAEDAALCLVERSVRLVGIDYLSVDGYEDAHGTVHRILLAAGIIVVECVDLTAVPPGPCTIFCLPLKIEGGDGAPARVVVETQDV